MGLFSKVVPQSELRLEDVIPRYDRRMSTVINIGKCLYQGYLPDGALTTSEYSHLKGFHDYLVYTSRKHGTKKRRKSMQVPKFTTEYLNKLIYTEKVDVLLESESNPNQAKVLDEFLHEVIEDNDYWNNTSQLAETMWNMGGKVERPTIKNNKIYIEFVTAERFYPIDWDNKQVYAGVFVATFIKNGYHYTKLTWIKRVDVETYRIEKELYKSKNGTSLGDKVSYNSVFDDQKSYTLNNFKSIPFTYCKPRIKNNQVLNSPLGIPIWFNAIDTIADLDVIFDTKFREVRYGGRTKVVPSYAMKRKTRKEADGSRYQETFFDPDNPTIEAYNLDPTKYNEGVKDLTSDIRDMSFTNLLNSGLDIFAIQVGFSVGTFVFNGTTMKTATEVITEKEASYQTKVLNEKPLEVAHKNLFLSCLELAQAFDLDPRVAIIPDDLKITIKFDDSVVIDKEKFIENMIIDAEASRIAEWRPVAERYKIPEETAKEWVAEAKNNDDERGFEGILALDE